MRYHDCYLLILIGIHFIVASPEGSTTRKRQTGRAVLTPNRMADIVLRRLRKNLEERNVEPLTVDGVGPLENGKFVGVGSIKRKGECELLHRNRSIGVPASLDVDRTQASFPCSVRYNFVSTCSVFGRNVCDGAATLTFRGLSIYLELKVRDTEDGKPQLDLCDVSDLGQVSLSFADNGSPLGSIFSWATSWMSALIRSRILTNVQDVLCNAVASNLT